MSEATPRPWKQEARMIYSPGEHGGTICQLSDPHESQYVEHHAIDIGGKDFREAMENGRLIVRTVNAHAALVSALRMLITRFERVCLDANGDMDPADQERIDEARAALSLAEPTP